MRCISNLNINVGLISLGCPKNLVDSEIMLGKLSLSNSKQYNYKIVNQPELADIIIINTCSFIDDAKKESIDTILEVIEYKKDKCKAVIVAGCLAQRYQNEILKEFPEIDAIIGTGNYEMITDVIENILIGEKQSICNLPQNVDYLDSKRVISTGSVYAYLKIAEGCDNNCTYCIIPSIRGKYISRTINSIVDEAKLLINQGIKELVVIAQDTTYYGIDLYGEKKLPELLRNISSIDGDFKIRVLYSYPELMDDALIREIATNDKIIKYIDLPIQHISDNILKLMGRKGTSVKIKELLMKIRHEIPNVILRTSLIVGFPGETLDDFNLLLDFVKEYKFERLGVFTYSREDNTPAYNMNNQIHPSTKKSRQKKIMYLQKEISVVRNKNLLETIFDVIVEGISEDGIFYFGRSYAEAPGEIDSRIYFTSIQPLNINDDVSVKILNYDGYDLIGEAKKP